MTKRAFGGLYSFIASEVQLRLLKSATQWKRRSCWIWVSMKMLWHSIYSVLGRMAASEEAESFNREDGKRAFALKEHPLQRIHSRFPASSFARGYIPARVFCS